MPKEAYGKSEVSRSKVYELYLCFKELVIEGRIVNKEHYLDILRRIGNQIRQNEQTFARENIPAHWSPMVTEFLAKTDTKVLPHPAYSPYLAS
ncbi:hypothetical protein TNCV_4532901 [Trichonephila clavipes]|nr:hypothetical protein TNCV_4532901 [Trichonephila clavipes]